MALKAKLLGGVSNMTMQTVDGACRLLEHIRKQKAEQTVKAPARKGGKRRR
jgi:hypothetical protein